MKPKESCYLANISTSSAEAGQEGKHGYYGSIGISDIEQIDCYHVCKATNVSGGGIRRILHDCGGGLQARTSDAIGTNTETARVYGGCNGEEITPRGFEAHGRKSDRTLPKVKSP